MKCTARVAEHCHDSQGVVGRLIDYFCQWLHYFQTEKKEKEKKIWSSIGPDVVGPVGFILYVFQY